LPFILNKNGDFQTKPFFNIPASGDQSIYDVVKSGRQHLKGIHIVELKDSETERENIVVGGFMKNGDWLMVYQQDREDAFLDWMKAQRIALSIILIAGVCIIVSALLMSRGIVSRFAQLDREKEMMNKQVIESGKLASIGELAAGIAHEINNPVAIMIEEAGWIEDLLEDEDLKNTRNFEEFKRALAQIHTQGIRCKDITHKLLSFARKSDSQVQKIHLNELVEEVVALSEQKASYENVTINMQLESQLPFIHVSSTEIQQILLNLINNALFAIDKKRPEKRADRHPNRDERGRCSGRGH
jgi:two-component system NtrC family sensor kinase